MTFIKNPCPVLAGQGEKRIVFLKEYSGQMFQSYPDSSTVQTTWNINQAGCFCFRRLYATAHEPCES